MNVKQLAVALTVLVAAGSAFADGTSHAKTRAEVKAELVQARAQGLLDINDLNIPPVAKSTKTRGEVKSDSSQAYS